MGTGEETSGVELSNVLGNVSCKGWSPWKNMDCRYNSKDSQEGKTTPTKGHVSLASPRHPSTNILIYTHIDHNLGAKTFERHFLIWLSRFFSKGNFFDSHSLWLLSNCWVTRRNSKSENPIYTLFFIVTRSLQISNLIVNKLTYAVICSDVSKHFKILISQFPEFGSIPFLSFFPRSLIF